MLTKNILILLYWNGFYDQFSGQNWPVGSKVGEASYRLNIFGLPTTKDANVGAAQAAKNGGITKIATVDKQINPQDKSFKIIVTGE